MRLQALPLVKERVAKATADAVAAATAAVRAKEPTGDALRELPPAGLDMDAVMNELEERASNDFRCARLLALLFVVALS